MNTDAELLSSYARENSEDAFAELVQRHVGLVYSTALRHLGGDAHGAEDVTQVVFAALARKAGSLSHHRALAGWLYLGAHHAAAQAVRTEQRRRAREQEAQTMHELTSPGSPPADWDRVRPVLDDALRELRDDDREAVLLRFFEQRPFDAIGAALHVTEDAARMRVARALDQLHTLLAKRGVTSTSSALAAVLANQAAATAPAGLAASVSGAALASAGGGAVSVLMFLHFMSTTKFIGGTSMIIGLLALGTAGYNVHAQREAETALDVEQRIYDLQTTRLRVVEARIQETEQRVAGLKQAGETAAVEAAAVKAAKAWNPVAEGKAFVQRHPNVGRAFAEYRDAMTTFTFGEFWKSRALTAAQIEEFKALMRVGRGWNQSPTVTLEGKRVVLSSPEEKITDSEFLLRLRDLIGDEGYKAYVWEHFPADFARTHASSVARGLAFTEAPLSPRQAEQVVKIMSPIFGAARRQGAGADVDWDAVDAQAAGILSAAQMPVWRSESAVGRAQTAFAISSPLSAKTTPAN